MDRRDYHLIESRGYDFDPIPFGAFIPVRIDPGLPNCNAAHILRAIDTDGLAVVGTGRRFADQVLDIIRIPSARCFEAAQHNI